MLPNLVLGLAAVFLFSDTAAALAGINRVNNCKTPASFISVHYEDGELAYHDSPNYNGSKTLTHAGPYVLPPQSTLFTPYHVTVLSGVSEKYVKGNMLEQDVSWGNDQGVFQFEYNLGKNTQTERLYFDLSFINCGPDSITSKKHCVFREGGYLVEFPQETSEKCPHIYCPHESNDFLNCTSAYIVYDSNETFACVDERTPFWENVNTTLTFCPTPEQLVRFNATLNQDQLPGPAF